MANGVSALNTTVSPLPVGKARNPLQVRGNGGVVGPVGVSTLFSYTVPAGRTAKVAQVSLHIERDTAAGAIGALFCQISINGFGITRLKWQAQNAPADQAIMGPGPDLLIAGDVFTGSGNDASTGGTTFMEAAFSGVEVDA